MTTTASGRFRRAGISTCSTKARKTRVPVAAAMLIAATTPSRARAPSTVSRHQRLERVRGRLVQPWRLAGVDGTITELTDPVCVSRRPPVVLSPPLAGHRWWDANGCCELVAPHRGATLPINGGIKPPEQFAID